jgi:hypothetical protein
LVYRCVSITERRGDRVISPLANPGTVEDVLVNGKPALYFDEAVVQTPVWTPIAATPTVDKLAPAIPGSTIDGGAARMPTLIFERDGVIVWISAFSYQQPAQVPLPTKADLIRVAESMRPLAERGTQ